MRPSDLPPGISYADIDAAQSVRSPSAERAWTARIAAIAKSTGIPLDPDAIEEGTTIDIGTIRAYDAFRLAVTNRVSVQANYDQAGARRVHIEIEGADEGEVATAVVVFA